MILRAEPLYPLAMSAFDQIYLRASRFCQFIASPPETSMNTDLCAAGGIRLLGMFLSDLPKVDKLLNRLEVSTWRWIKCVVRTHNIAVSACFQRLIVLSAGCTPVETGIR